MARDEIKMSKKTQTDKSKTVDVSPTDWQAKAAEYLAGWQRAQADLVNARTRADEEKQSFIKFAQADLIMQLLTVLDNFKRAAEHTPQSNNDNTSSWSNWASGIQAVEKQFEMILQNNGVSEIMVKVGDAFDPQTHDAIASEQSEHSADVITQIIEPGYTLHGKVLRAPKVKVAK